VRGNVGDPAYWPDSVRITLIVISGFWLITLPFMFWKRMRYTALPYAGLVLPVLVALSLVFGQSSNDEGETQADQGVAAVSSATAAASPTVEVTTTTPTATATPSPTPTASPTPTPTPTPEPTPAPTPEPTATPTPSNTVSVGSLDLTVIGIEWYDSTRHNIFNDANLRVEISALNARGGEDSEYNISATFFELVDENGITHGASWSCADCPDEVWSIDLVRGGRVRGFVYFEVPADRRLVELIYEPLFSTNKARIALR